MRIWLLIVNVYTEVEAEDKKTNERLTYLKLIVNSLVPILSYYQWLDKPLILPIVRNSPSLNNCRELDLPVVKVVPPRQQLIINRIASNSVTNSPVPTIMIK